MYKNFLEIYFQFYLYNINYKFPNFDVTWYTFAAKNINKNKSLINTKLIKQRKTIMIGIAMKAIFFEIM